MQLTLQSIKQAASFLAKEIETKKPNIGCLMTQFIIYHLHLSCAQIQDELTS